MKNMVFSNKPCLFTKSYVCSHSVCSQGHGPHPPQRVGRVSWCEAKQLEAAGFVQSNYSQRILLPHVMFFAAVGVAVNLNFGVEARIFHVFFSSQPSLLPLQFPLSQRFVLRVHHADAKALTVSFASP